MHSLFSNILLSTLRVHELGCLLEMIVFVNDHFDSQTKKY